MDTSTAGRLLGETPLVAAYRQARAEGLSWTTPDQEQHRRDRSARNRRARHQRRVNRRRSK